MLAVLEETPIGQSLLAFWENMPSWVLGNVLFSSCILLMVSIPGEILRLFFSWSIMPLVLSLIAWLVQRNFHPSLTLEAFYKHHYPLSFSIVVLFSLTLMLRQNAVMYIVLVFLSAIASFALCLPLRFMKSSLVAWHNAFMMAVHFPIYALGLAMLAALFLMMSWLTHGGLFLLVPTLWMVIAVRTTQEVINEYEKQVI